MPRYYVREYRSTVETFEVEAPTAVAAIARVRRRATPAVEDTGSLRGVQDLAYSGTKVDYYVNALNEDGWPVGNTMRLQHE